MATTPADFASTRRTDVRRALTAAAGVDLTTFFHALPGYWPADVAREVNELADLEPEHSELVGSFLADLAGPARDPDLGDGARRVLPVPHPLDADWRFTVRTRERLLLMAASVSVRKETLLLGTPSIFSHMCSQLDLRGAVLVDANPATVEAANRLADGHELLSARQADLLAGINIGLEPVFDTVIADPPWYFAEHRAFLDASSALLVPGGVLLLAAAPRGTRPEAEHERAELLAHAVDAGFDLVRAMDGELEYTSSPFERAALREGGLLGVPTNWRRADLLIFKKTSRIPLPGSTSSCRPTDWIDLSYRRTRFKVHRGILPTSQNSSELSGGVSKSVSRLAPERQTANLWTSGNGAFSVCADLIDAMVRGDTSWESSAAGRALLGHLDEEQDDLRDWGWV